MNPRPGPGDEYFPPTTKQYREHVIKKLGKVKGDIYPTGKGGVLERLRFLKLPYLESPGGRPRKT
jgi:hypothetical protein